MTKDTEKGLLLDLVDAKTRIAQLEAELKKANSHAEHFEREWYLRGDQIEGLEAQLTQRQMPADAQTLVKILAANWAVWPAGQAVEQTSLGDVFCSTKGRAQMFGTHQIASDQDIAAVTREQWSDRRSLAASPTQRVPLTDEQIGVIRWSQSWCYMSTNDELMRCTQKQMDEFARAIEAAHGIKGEEDGK